VRAYASIFASRVQILLQYRAVAAAGIATQVFWGLVRTMIFDAFYRGSGTQPLTHAQSITYVWLGQAMLVLTMMSTDADVTAMIRTGNVAYEMVRPLDLYNLWFIRAFSGRAVPMLMRGIPIFVLAALFFGLTAPVSIGAGALFIASTLFALLTAASIIALLTISMLWTISGEGISRLAPGLVFVFSGIIVPLPFLPSWLQRASSLMPFRGLIDTPLRIYLGQLHGSEAFTALALQGVWLIVLIVIGRVVMSRGLRRLVAQGG
jgi:ABC-2 type transport system permease protein